MMPFEFHFLRPLWLLMLLPLVVLLWRQYRADGDARSWHRVVDRHLLPHLLSGDQAGPAHLPRVLLGLGWLLLVLALAGPTWQQLPQPVYQALQFRVIALDLSPSMHATDLKPSRLARARYEVLDLLQRIGDGQTALIAYGAEPYIVSPLTGDAATIAAQVPLLDTGLLPAIGTRRTDLALRQAGDLLRQAGASEGEVIVITDDLAQPAAAREAAKRLAGEGFRVSVLGVGTEKGAPVTLADGGLLKDRDGAIVVPRLDQDELAALAMAGDGRYVTAGFGDRDIDALLSIGRARPAGDAEKQDATTEQWREEGPWLLLLLLPLAALAFRRGWLTPLSLGLLCLLPLPEAHAGLWEDLWLRTDQQAMQRLESGQPDQALPLFERPDWRAAAAYQAGDYEQALASLDRLDDGGSPYNRGNALARLGRLEEAVTAYDEALRSNPADADARHNRDLVKALLAQRSQQAPEPQESVRDQSQQDEQSGEDAAPEQSDQGEQEDQGEKGEQDDQQAQGDGAEQATEDGGGQATESAAAGDPQPGEEDAGGASSGTETKQRGADGESTEKGTDPGDQGKPGSHDDATEPDQDGDEPGGDRQVTSDRQDDLGPDNEQSHPDGKSAEQRQQTPGGSEDRDSDAQSGGGDRQAEAPARSGAPLDSPSQDGDTADDGVAETRAEEGGATGGTETAPSAMLSQDDRRPGEDTATNDSDRPAAPDDRGETRGGQPRPDPASARPGLADLLGDGDTRGPASAPGTQLAGDGSEDAQALEQLLRRVEDDPGGLLRQRFLLQHLRRHGQLPQ